MCPRALTRASRAFAGFVAAAVILTSLSPACGTSLTWQVQVVDGDGDAGRHSSLAIATNGTVYALYHDNGGAVLRLATLRGGAWSFEAVAGPGYFEGDTTLVLDWRGDLHISYYDAVTTQVRYGRRAASGGPWNLTDVDFGYVDGFNRLAVDRFGIAHVAYSLNNGTLRYAHLSGSFWIRENVDSSVILARYVSLAVDRDGRPHIAYYGNGQLRYASKPDVAWILETVDPRDYVAVSVQIALDSTGRPHFAYYDSIAEAARYATRSLSGWALSVIDPSGDAGRGVSLVVGRDDRPRVAYYARIPADLLYAERVNDTWDVQTVDDVGVVGWEPSLALAPNGTPHVLYYDWTLGALRHAVGLPVLGARTVGASEVTETAALLQGEVTSLDAFSAANVSFDWRPEGEVVWRSASAASLSGPVPFEARIGGLAPGRTYEFRATVEAGGLTEHGRLLTFTTRVLRPLDPAPILLISTSIAVAAMGLSLSAYIWFRGPISFRRRGGRRRSGQA